MKILVSACLLGENCKYSGGNNYSEKAAAFVKVPSYTSAAPQLGLRGCRMASSTPFSLAMANALAAPARNAASTLTPSFVTTSPFTISAGVRGTDRPPSTSGQTGMTSCPSTKAAAFSL